MNRRILMLVIAGLFASGCAQEKLEIKNPFPTREELVQISAQDIADEAVEAPEVSIVETWELQGPLPEQFGYRPHAAQNAVEEAFYAGIGSDRKVLGGSEAMHCAARETGRFVLEHDKLPYASLKNFIFARCGALVTGASIQYRTRSGATEQDGVALAEAAAQTVAGSAAEAETRMDSGLWYGMKGDKVAMVTTYGRVLVDMQPTPMRASSDGEVVLEGRVLLANRDDIFGLINNGRFGYERCKSDPTVEMPTFRVTCPVSKSDDFAYFQLMVSREASIMASTVLEQLVWSGGELADVYQSPATRRALARAQAVERSQQGQLGSKAAVPADSDGEQDEFGDAVEELEHSEQPQVEPMPLVEPSDEASTADYPSRFVALLNQVRKDANMGPVEHAAEQSAVIQGVTEQFFAAGFGTDVEASNKLALGILAGWDVSGAIIDADMSSDWSAEDKPAQLLETMLESPKGRQTLMDPSSSEIALGKLDREYSTGAVVASYAFVPDDHPNRRVDRVVDALSEQRKAFGSRAAKEDPKLRARSRKLAKHIEAGNAGVIEVRDELIDAAIKRYRKPVYGYALVSNSLDNIDFPNDLLTSKNLPVTVVVAPFTEEGYPWTMYAIVLVFPKQPKAKIAGMDAPATSARTSATTRSR